MPLDDRPFDSIVETDLQALLNDQEREGKTLEFKEAQPGNSDGDRKEFLADVTSFANTSGGHLIFGIKESGGIATEVCGISVDPDAELGRMENLLRTGVQHRLSGYAIRAIALQNRKTAIIIRVPRSWALPHRVTLGGHDKFYARNSTGKYSLDVPQLQSLFLLSETTAERIRDFRADRLTRINGNETPVLIPRGPKTILHVIPFSAFTPGTNLNVSAFENDIRALPPIRSPGGGLSHRHNFDGFVTFSSSRDGEESLNYVQIFRSGSIEAVNASLIREHNGQMVIGGYAWEQSLIDKLPSYLQAQSRLNVQLPVFIMLSVLGVKGYSMYVPPGSFDSGDTIDRDMLIAPEIMVEKFDSDAAQILKPAFDVIWNAAGFSGSLSYDSQGQRRRE
jgi:hypothetical protein